MKKTTRLLLVIVCLLLVSCSSEEKKEAIVYTDQLKSKDKIVVGISPDYPPFELLNIDGTIEGFDPDILYEIISYLDEELEVEFAIIEFDNIITAVQTGQVDIGLSGFTYDPDRDLIFTTPYVESNQAILVTKDSEINSIKDLKGKTVGGQTGTVGYECAQNIEGIKEAVSFADNMIGFVSVGNSIDAYVADYGVVNKYAQVNDMKVIDDDLQKENMSIIIKNGNTLLEDKINECIDKVLVSDKYKQIREKWGV